MEIILTNKEVIAAMNEWLQKLSNTSDAHVVKVEKEGYSSYDIGLKLTVSTAASPVEDEE